MKGNAGNWRLELSYPNRRSLVNDVRYSEENRNMLLNGLSRQGMKISGADSNSKEVDRLQEWGSINVGFM